MGRYLAAAMVVVADTLLVLGMLPPPAVAAYALAAALVAGCRHRFPVAAFVVTQALATLSGGSYVLLAWVAYHTGHGVRSRKDTAVVAGATLGAAAFRAVAAPIPQVVAGFVVFVVLPLLVGRYLAQHSRERALLAEREQLRERLRIARDMHDSLGRRLSLVAVQAAVLQVSGLPAPQRQAVDSLADAARDAVTELYQLLGSLRGAATHGVATIDGLLAEFRAAGVAVTFAEQGTPRELPAAADTALFRVVEEGLTNAVKHASGQPVTVRVGWEADAVLLTVTNPLADGIGIGSGGHGLTGLRERLELAGGFLDHRVTDGSFRLVAMLPVAEPAPAIGRVRAAALGVATAALLFGVLPASMVVGVS